MWFKATSSLWISIWMTYLLMWAGHSSSLLLFYYCPSLPLYVNICLVDLMASVLGAYMLISYILLYWSIPLSFSILLRDLLQPLFFNSGLSDVTMVIPALFCSICIKYHFLSIYFQFFVSFNLKQVSCRQHMYRSCFLSLQPLSFDWSTTSIFI